MKPIIIGILSLNFLLFLSFLFSSGYPWPAVILHAISLTPVFWIGYKQGFAALHIKSKELLLLLIPFGVALFVRTTVIDTLTPGIQGDEVIVAYSALELGNSFTPFVTSNFGHGSIIPYMVLFSIKLFGNSIFAIRLPSILFGVAGVFAFYLLLRLFFSSKFSLVGSFLFATSYPLISLSRVIYEPTASIFFQISTIFFAFLGTRRRNIFFLAASGLCLGLGNYTYVNFRLFTLFFLILFGILLFNKRKNVKDFAIQFGVLISFTIVGMLPLLHYFLVNPDQLSARVAVLSLFNQGLRTDQVVGNIVGGISQLRYVFLYPGDPNFRINPGKSAMIDITTTVTFIVGLFYLLKKEIKLLLMLVFLSLPFLLSDIVAYEAGPANTFYGFAHPNTMRLSGIIPFIIFVALYGLFGISRLVERNMEENNSSKSAIRLVKIYGAVVFVTVCTFLNYTLYFAQQYDPYTNTVNGVTHLKIVSEINKMDQSKRIYATKFIKDDIRFQYFLNPKRDVEEFEPKTYDEAVLLVSQADVVFIDSNFNLEILKALAENQPDKKRLLIHRLPDGVDAFVFLGDTQITIDDFLPI